MQPHRCERFVTRTIFWMRKIRLHIRFGEDIRKIVDFQFFLWKKIFAENLSSEAISHARPSSLPEALAHGGVVWSLLPGPQDAPLECTGTGCVHEYDLASGD